MSAASDRYENEVAKAIDSIAEIKATRPSVSAAYADVLLQHDKYGKTWLEVKMNHTDNLGNPRVFYKDGKWQTTYKTPLAAYAVQLLNKDAQTKKWLSDIAKYTGIPLNSLKIPTTKGGLKEPGAVPLDIMKSYFSQPGVNRYIADKANVDLGKLVTEHYTTGKAEPAYYMQAGDDFYRISNKDPFKVGNIVPLLGGRGNFKMRVSTRSQFYEVQAEIKITKMPNSSFSLAPKTQKKNPFL